MKTGGLRFISWLLIAAILAGCASTATTAIDVQWRRVPSVPGCIGASSQWDLRNQFSVRLQPELQTTLLEQLNKQPQQQPLEAPLCWYQMHGGDLLLRAGNFCGLSQEVQFHRDGPRWALVRFENILGQCGT